MLRGRLPGIQLGRAVAAATVFYFHSYVALGFFAAKEPTFKWLATHGAAGVDLFFAISGFIVCHVAAAESFNALDFLKKRFFRIYPLNAVVTLLIVACGLYGIRIADDISAAHVVRSLLIVPQQAPINSVGWTLEYEIVFYLLAAALLPLGGPRALLAWCLGAWALSLVVAPTAPIAARFIDGHYVDFAAGIIAYMLATRLPVLALRWQWIVAVALASAGLGLFHLGNVLEVAHFTPLGCGVAVLGLALVPWAPRPLVAFGDISYGFYLWHWPVVNLANWAAFAVFLPQGAHAAEPWRWLTFALICLAASASWIWLERPILAWSRSVLPQPQPAAGSTAIRYSSASTL